MGYFRFPNLKSLRICHSALRWTHFDGPETNQLVELVKGCSRLESLDITRINIREAQIRPQLEGLTEAVSSMDGMLLLKGINVSISWPQYNLRPYLSDLLAEEHLATYRRRGIKFLVDLKSLWRDIAVLKTFSAIHECVRDTATVHSNLREVMPAAGGADRY